MEDPQLRAIAFHAGVSIFLLFLIYGLAGAFGLFSVIDIKVT
jgi:hypothetical protein